MNSGSGQSIEEQWAAVDGRRMRYLRAGSGDAMVLLHGLFGYSFSWRYTLPVLAECAAVYAPDMLGIGFSDRPTGLDCSMRASAERFLRFLDAAKITSCDLLATSHGGAIAMVAAALEPGRVRRLVLVAPVNPWSLHGRRLALVFSLRPVERVFLLCGPLLRSAHHCLVRRLYADVGRIRPGTLDGYAAPLTLPGTLEYGLSVARSWNQDLGELGAMLPRIADVPTTLIWGSLDRAVSPASAEPLSRNFKKCRVIIFDGVGHLPYEEAPEQFNQAVRDVLRT